MNIPKPMCRKCRRMVVDFTSYPNHLAHSTTFVARCHGEQEHHSVPNQVLYNSTRILPGWAFPATIGEVDNITPVR